MVILLLGPLPRNEIRTMFLLPFHTSFSSAFFGQRARYLCAACTCGQAIFPAKLREDVGSLAALQFERHEMGEVQR